MTDSTPAEKAATAGSVVNIIFDGPPGPESGRFVGDWIERPDGLWALRIAHLPAAWQPIKTAPKDGTKVDLWFGAHSHPQRITDARWGKPEHSCGEYGRYCDSCPTYDGWVVDDGFTGYLTGREGCFRKGPTHWMALPCPPNAERSGASPLP